MPWATALSSVILPPRAHPLRDGSAPVLQAVCWQTGRLLLSRTAVSEIGKQLWEDYQAFKSRDLAEYDIAYLFIDGIAERIRPGQRREPVLAAWGLLSLRLRRPGCAYRGRTSADC